MINLKVLKSTDPNAEGTYEYQFDVLTLGRTEKNDLIIKDQLLPSIALMFIIEGNSLFVQTLHPDLFCFINNKKMSGRKLLQAGDIVVLGSHSFEILGFKKTDQAIDFGKLYENFMKNNQAHQFALDILDKEIQNIESNKNT